MQTDKAYSRSGSDCSLIINANRIARKAGPTEVTQYGGFESDGCLIPLVINQCRIFCDVFARQVLIE